VDIGQCFVAQGAKTPAAGPAFESPYKQLGVLVFCGIEERDIVQWRQQSLHLQEPRSSARASRNSQKCF